MQQDTQRGHLIDVPWRSRWILKLGLKAVRDGSTNSLEARADISR